MNSALEYFFFLNKHMILVQRLLSYFRFVLGSGKMRWLKSIRFSVGFSYIWADVTPLFTVYHIPLCVTFFPIVPFARNCFLFSKKNMPNFLVIFWLREAVLFSGKTIKSNIKLYSVKVRWSFYANTTLKFLTICS